MKDLERLESRSGKSTVDYAYSHFFVEVYKSRRKWERERERERERDRDRDRDRQTDRKRLGWNV